MEPKAPGLDYGGRQRFSLKLQAEHKATILSRGTGILGKKHSPNALFVRTKRHFREEGKGRDARSPENGELEELEEVVVDSRHAPEITLTRCIERNATLQYQARVSLPLRNTPFARVTEKLFA